MGIQRSCRVKDVNMRTSGSRIALLLASFDFRDLLLKPKPSK